MVYFCGMERENERDVIHAAFQSLVYSAWKHLGSGDDKACLWDKDAWSVLHLPVNDTVAEVGLVVAERFENTFP